MLPNKIYCMDAFAGLRNIPDASIDFVLTDPPYGMTANKWDTSFDLGSFWQEIQRVIKPHGAICVWSQMPFTVDLIHEAPRGMYRYEWVVQKTNPTGFLNARRMPLKAHESVQVFYKRLPKYHPQMAVGAPYSRQNGYRRRSSNYKRYDAGTARETREYPAERFPVDVIKTQWRPPFSGTRHPTQKPLSITEYMMRTYTDPDDLVLDPFMGSGTTAVAARNLGRRFIGFENNPEYWQISQKRLYDEA